MTLHLFQIEEHPERIAVSKISSYVPDGAFFLDFSRPLKFLRWFGFGEFGVHINRFGFVEGILVPVIHQGEDKGGYIISVHRSDPSFSTIRKLWKARYPSGNRTPDTKRDGLHIVSDFATQFPSDCQAT